MSVPVFSLIKSTLLKSDLAKNPIFIFEQVACTDQWLKTFNIFSNTVTQLQALKSHKESGEHKQRIVMYVTLKGIRIVDEKTQVSVKITLDDTLNWL